MIAVMVDLFDVAVDTFEEAEVLSGGALVSSGVTVPRLSLVHV